MDPTNTLPDFEKPPVVETSLALQFEPLPGLQTPQIGLLWSEFRESYPYTEQHPPIDPVFETFGSRPKQRSNIDVTQSFPSPRCWFLDKERTQLIQIQQNQFIHNWRKTDDVQIYPRYEVIRPQFKSEIERFVDFLTRENLGDLKPNQCEVAYTNHIMPGDVWESHSKLDQVITMWKSEYSDDFLPPPENCRFSSQWIFYDDSDEPLGRLYASVQPALLPRENIPIFVLTLTARSRPHGSGVDGAFKSFDRGREMIVRGFKSITSEDMHKAWRSK